MRMTVRIEQSNGGTAHFIPENVTFLRERELRNGKAATEILFTDGNYLLTMMGVDQLAQEIHYALNLKDEA